MCLEGEMEKTLTAIKKHITGNDKSLMSLVKN